MKRLFKKMLRDAETVGLTLLGIGLTIAMVTLVLPADPKPQKHGAPVHGTKA